MYTDDRGYLLFPIKDGKYMDKMTEDISKECTYSVNKKNVFRGLHINTFGKLITCIVGEFIDIMVDINVSPPKVNYYHLKPGTQVYCPGNYAHGFFCLKENSVLSYHCEGIFGNEEGGLLNYRDPILNIELPKGLTYNDIIINEKDSNAPFLKYDYFIIGHRGFIGSNILNELIKNNKRVYCVNYRLHEKEKIKKLLEIYKPKYFINCAGITGNPNIKWCDTNKLETLNVNVIYQIELLKICEKLNIHYTLLGSGAIFKDISEATSKTLGNDYTNFYSECRILLEKLVKDYSNYLLLRINYPISYKKENELNSKNLLNKLLNYSKIEDISLSITDLDQQIPDLINLIENKKLGIKNFVLDEQQSLKDIIEKYTEKTLKQLNKELIKTERNSTKLLNI